MIKNPITKIQETEDSVPKKTKKNKHETVCYDKRRSYSHCGLCGSDNIASEGVTFCNLCGEEVDFLVPGTGNYSFFDKGESPAWPSCECKEIYEYTTIQKVNKKKVIVPATGWRRSRGRTVVSHCLVCGATTGPKCPACGKQCWSKGTQRFCQSCGYRSL